MKAIVLDAAAESLGLRMADRPIPEPGPREIVLRVRAAALN